MKKTKILLVSLLTFCVVNTFETKSSYAEGNVDSIIVGNDYEKNFTSNGSATINLNIATLTPDQRNLAGNTILNTKIDMKYSFNIDGEVNLGDKSHAQGGADGMSFVFQPGDNTIIGIPGGSMGIGGIIGAFGFKLDTFYNQNGQAAFTPDPAKFSKGADGNPLAFGAFVDGTDGVARTVESSATAIGQPTQNQFKPISIHYDGTLKIMNVVYDGISWTEDVSGYIGSNESMSFAITAGTGYNTNLQQFKLDRFEYRIAEGKVIAKYIDELGNVLAQEEIYKGDLETEWKTIQKDIPGYKLKEVIGNVEGTFEVNDQEVIYVYIKDETEPSTTEPSTTEPSTTEPSTTEPSTTEPSTTEPSTTEPSTTEPSTTEPSTTEPSTTEPSTTEESTTVTGQGGNNNNSKGNSGSKMPNTGEVRSWTLTLAGLATIAALSVWFVFKRKKSK